MVPLPAWLTGKGRRPKRPNTREALGSKRPEPRMPEGANTQQRRTHNFGLGITRLNETRAREAARTEKIINRTGHDGLPLELGEKERFLRKQKK